MFRLADTDPFFCLLLKMDKNADSSLLSLQFVSRFACMKPVSTGFAFLSVLVVTAPMAWSFSSRCSSSGHELFVSLFRWALLSCPNMENMPFTPMQAKDMLPQMQQMLAQMAQMQFMVAQQQSSLAETEKEKEKEKDSAAEKTPEPPLKEEDYEKEEDENDDDMEEVATEAPGPKEPSSGHKTKPKDEPTQPQGPEEATKKVYKRLGWFTLNKTAKLEILARIHFKPETVDGYGKGGTAAEATKKDYLPPKPKARPAGTKPAEPSHPPPEDKRLGT